MILPKKDDKADLNYTNLQKQTYAAKKTQI